MTDIQNILSECREIYCNRERYMAMFGFVNFKKSHRSDYANPHFGYWYQEI